MTENDQKEYLEKQLIRYANDISEIYQSEKEKRKQLELTQKQLVNYANDLKQTYDELQERTNQLIESARFEVMGQITAGCGHDLNNILTGITLFNTLIIRTEDLSKIKEYAKIQEESLQLGMLLVKNLLSFSRTQKGDYTSFFPAQSLETVITILQKKIDKFAIKLTKNIDVSLTFQGDEGHFSQISMNLIINAVESMPKGGQLEVSLKKDTQVIILEVKDTGEGISEEKLDKIYNMLYTSKSEGSGIGLYVVNKIIKDVGGSIDVISSVGKGTTFTVTLPIIWKNLQI